MPHQAIQGRIEYIQEFYQRQDEQVEAMCARPFDYLSQAEMDAFVENSARRLEGAYRRFWVEGVIPPAEAVSTLENL